MSIDQSSETFGNAKPGYGDAYAAFSIEEALAKITPEMGGVLNPAIICCDRHCGGGEVALTWIGEDGTEQIFTFEELRDARAVSPKSCTGKT